ncbi:MAG: hypothetical protein LR120_09290 [Dehalococcoidia bacterium]|nr:hypothetical protein [Chloroflexota bacterium]MCD5399925.1 hypothetical protein [Dehalococcoidia bacterium]
MREPTRIADWGITVWPHRFCDEIITNFSYFESGVGVTPWSMERLTANWETPLWYQALTELSEMVAESGFMIRRMVDPRPTEEQVRQNPDLDDCHRAPYFLIFELVAS